MVGYGGELLFRYRSFYWLWCPISGPVVGALVGGLLYDIFLFIGSESPLNRPYVLSCHRPFVQYYRELTYRVLIQVQGGVEVCSRDE